MIFRQETIQKQAKQIRKKNKHENNRKRNPILNFRVSDEEYELINKKLSLVKCRNRIISFNFLQNMK